MARRTLSSRDISILGLAATGKADKEIATALGLSLSTVRTYWGRIREKLGASTRAQAVGLYVRSQSTTSSLLSPNAKANAGQGLDLLPCWKAQLDGKPLWANTLGTRWLRKFEREDWRDFQSETRVRLAEAAHGAAKLRRPSIVVVKLSGFEHPAHFVFTPSPNSDSEAIVILVTPPA